MAREKGEIKIEVAVPSPPVVSVSPPPIPSSEAPREHVQDAENTPRFPMSEVASHGCEEDAWIVVSGKVGLPSIGRIPIWASEDLLAHVSGLRLYSIHIRPPRRRR